MLNYKRLIKILTWSVAVLGGHVAYADESSIIEYFNEEKEAPSLETKIQENKLEVNPELVKKGSDIKETKVNSDAYSQKRTGNNKYKNDKINLRKTHYGIGYEYRKSMREQMLRGTERVVRPEKAQRPERVDRPERIGRPERIERPERVNRPERPGR